MRSKLIDVCIPDNVSLPEYIFGGSQQYADKVAFVSHYTFHPLKFGHYFYPLLYLPSNVCKQVSIANITS